jgi:hypothetical protein
MCFRRITLVFILITILISCGEKKSEYPVIIETIDGVKVVTNPDFPRDGFVTCELDEELSIGGDVDDEDYIFHRPQDMKVAANGTIFVMDWGDSTFKIYDKDGKYIRTIGGRGQGPGEFERLIYFSLGTDGNIYVMDSVNHRVAILNEYGDYIAGFRIEDGLPNEIETDQNNFIYFGISFQDGETRRLSIHRYNSSGEEIINYGVFRLVQPVITRRTKTSVSSTTSRLAPTTVWTVNPEGKLYAAYGDEYQISVYDPNGKLSLKFGREYTPLSNKYFGQRGEPKYIGIFNIITRRWLFDENGNIWIEMYTDVDPEEIVYDVYSPEGIYLKQIKVKHRIRHLKDGKAYCLVRSEDDFVSAKRFKRIETTG